MRREPARPAEAPLATKARLESDPRPRYVVNKAQCRVLLTAPPGDGQDPTRVVDETAEVPQGHLPVPSS